MKIGALKSFNKGFSYPGYKTTDVLNDIQQNVTKDIYGIGFEEKTAKLQQSIKDAEVITISAGANDILPLFKQIRLQVRPPSIRNGVDDPPASRYKL